MAALHILGGIYSSSKPFFWYIMAALHISWGLYGISKTFWELLW